MNRHKPTQKRSRQRVNSILNAAAEELAKVGTADKLTTTAVSRRAGIPVSSIYRYFIDRWEIVAALIDKEIELIDEAIAAELDQAEMISLDFLTELFMNYHFNYFRSNRRAVVLWFGTRQSEIVLEKVSNHYEVMGNWYLDSARDADLARDFPSWGGEALTWLGDRVFEVIFRADRSAEEQEAILAEAIEMISRQLRKYATADGRDGISSEEFHKRAGVYRPPKQYD